MVLDDITHDAVLVEVPASPLRAEVLGEVNLHVADVLAIPQGLEHDVAEAQHGEVLDELLAQVVVDAVGALLGELGGERSGERAGGFEVAPEGLLHDDARVADLHARVPRRVLRHGHENRGRDGQVEDAHAAAAPLLFLHGRVQRLKVLRVVVQPGVVVAARQKLLHLGGAVLCAGDATREGVAYAVLELLRAHLTTRVPVHDEVLWQMFVIEQSEDSGVHLLLGQVTGRAEDAKR
mmetsp:Transcript_13518/g.22103  ORF Transcript_13518/g.22103 Transcript_13518/m.22103 type:complete len:236 (+) Transcript_13518:548-1255(+)